MAKRKEVEYTCTATYTEGCEKRLTEAMTDLYYKLKREGRLPERKHTEETA